MAKNTYGKTWWGQQWLNSLKDIDYDNRLPRGKTYANKGMVSSIKIKDNHIKAKVQGSRRSPYKVDIILPPFFDPELSKFLDRLASRPTIISKLLNRELDGEILPIAEGLGLKVFPRKWSDFKMQCSCPDWAVPCKHLAAVVYKVSTEIDNDPFLVFKLHNVDLIGQFNKQGIYVSTKTSQVPKITDLYFGDTDRPKQQFLPFEAYRKLNFSKLGPIHGPLTKLLVDHPAFYQGSGNFKDKYLKQVNTAVKKAQRLVQGKISFLDLIQELDPKGSMGHHAKERVEIDPTFHAVVHINSESFSFSDFLVQLSQVPGNRTQDYQASTAALHSVLHFAVNLLANGAITPQIVQLKDNNYMVRWLPAMLSKDVRALVDQLEGMVPGETFVWTEDGSQREIDNNRAFNLLSLFLTEIMAILSDGPQNDEFLKLFFQKYKHPFNRPGEEALSGGVMAWTQKFYMAQGNFQPMLVVEELKGERFEIGVKIRGKAAQWGSSPVPLERVLTDKKYEKSRYEILQSLVQISAFIEGLDAYINSLGRQKIVMGTETFAPFLMDIIPALKLLDVDILLPKSLQEILKPKPSIRLKSTKNKTFIGLKDIFDFDWQVALGQDLVHEKEFKELMRESRGLIKYKSNYIYVDPHDLNRLYKHFSGSKDLNSFQILRAALSGEYQGAPIAFTDEVRETIRQFTQVEDIPQPEGLNARLRPYQQRGFSWMYRNARIGFGSVIADDMGLGKTLQVICTLLKYKEEGLLDKEKALVVVPTGLLGNWQREIENFAPSLAFKVHHGTKRQLDKKDRFDVLLSSYGIVRSDAPELKKHKWHTVVIDEAQNIKNSMTAQAKAIKSIPATNYIAMSGTPVENRLSEMWSIMDFSNRGFLGNAKEFNESFGIPIEQQNDREAADRLKRTVAPFMMRRLKSDKSIISDLPEKIEMDTYATLAKKQASLYEQTLDKAMKDIEGIEATDTKAMFVRRGLVLQMIMALKQICNHPTNYLKNKILEPKLSGKTELLFTTLDNILENGEKVLIFTQFAEMGKMLQHFIAEKYGDEPLFYHGGCSLKQRREMVDGFQNNPAHKIFVLSLKAAGTGLNLTAANHVIHYDLWWNPAVEAQATDRAYRIGQKKDVMVHRFITKGTFEEKINQMILDKKSLAEMTVATGENWIGNLSNQELKEMFKI